jgi:hypothetical protein
MGYLECLRSLVVTSLVSVVQAEPVPVLNPRFENGQNGWAFKDKGISLVSGEAAHSGSQGLRINRSALDNVNLVRHSLGTVIPPSTMTTCPVE